MAFTIRKVDEPIERLIVTGMIVSKPFMEQLIPFYQPHLLLSNECRTVGQWCLEYWQQYKNVPGQHIEDIFESHARNGLNEDEAGIIATMLGVASEEFERADQFNADYLLDQAERHLRSRSLSILAEDVKAALASPMGGCTEAERLLEEYHRVARPQSAGVCPFTDRSRIQRAFADPATPLFGYGGALGEVMNQRLVRAGFVVFLAPPKRGKSWWLMEMGLKASSNGCNVAFFECGDMTEDQWLRRFHVRASFNPYRHYDPRYQGAIRIPDLDEHGVVVYDEHEVASLDWRDAVRTGRFLMKKKLRDRRFKLSCHPSSTLSISQVRTQLDMWERIEGFLPDVIIFDYADIMASEKHAPKEFRHQENEKWKGLRALSQERHALVLTASQSDADGMSRETLRMANFSEDMRKLAHVTAMYGLNQTLEEKRKGLMRVNEIVVREGDFDSGRTVTVLQALQVGRPVLKSFWTPRKEGSDGE